MAAVKGNLGFTRSMCRVGENGRLYLLHESYGEIPIVGSAAGVGPLSASKAFRPALPKDSIRANVNKQNLEKGPVSVTSWEPVYALPRYYYVDSPLTCRDCRAGSVFTAKEQQYWYETLRLPTFVEVNRCSKCREKQRARKALDLATRRKREAPGDLKLQLAEARARLQYHESVGEGRLDQVISAARKVAKQSPEHTAMHHAAMLIEAKAHYQAGRPQQSLRTLQTLLLCPESKSGKQTASQTEARKLYKLLEALK